MNFEEAADFIWKHGRLLERRIFEYFFLGGSKDSILTSLMAYQNDDGGFGNAIEPDLRTPNSQPLFTEFALRVLYDCNIKDLKISYKACDYIAKHADLNKGISTIHMDSGEYPRASHWNNPLSTEPSMERLTGLVGLLNWQGIKHPWLDKATEACLDFVSTNRYDDAHTILTTFCLLESLPQTEQITRLYDKLANDLASANFLRMDAYSENYGLSPLEFVPSPTSYCKKIFQEDIIIQHLEALKSQQDKDGGWHISWDPPGETAKFEWRAIITLKNLIILKQYKKLNF
ncbi:MAG TPA: hypothetical protein GXZ26_10965 [Firmicutes bacterium]|nr:hypothetical protein [Bacillota bacterium]